MESSPPENAPPPAASDDGSERSSPQRFARRIPSRRVVLLAGVGLIGLAVLVVGGLSVLNSFGEPLLPKAVAFDSLLTVEDLSPDDGSFVLFETPELSDPTVQTLDEYVQTHDASDQVTSTPSNCQVDVFGYMAFRALDDENYVGWNLDEIWERPSISFLDERGSGTQWTRYFSDQASARAFLAAEVSWYDGCMSSAYQSEGETTTYEVRRLSPNLGLESIVSTSITSVGGQVTHQAEVYFRRGNIVSVLVLPLTATDGSIDGDAQHVIDVAVAKLSAAGSP